MDWLSISWNVISGAVGFLSGAIALWLWAAPLIEFKVSWRKIAKNAKKILEDMHKDHFRPDIIVSAGRAGGVLAALLSGNYDGKKIMILGVDMSYEWKDGAREEELYFPPIDLKNKKVLVCVGEVHTGRTLQNLVDACKANGAIDIKTASLFHSEIESFPPTYFGEKLNERTRMPWHFIPNYEKSSFPKAT